MTIAVFLAILGTYKKEEEPQLRGSSSAYIYFFY